MSSEHEAEIRASVAAHQDLGSGYNDAVAEGLVERIGAEIDKRIDARLGPSASVGAGGAVGAAGFPMPPGSAGPAGPGPGPGGFAGPGDVHGPGVPPGYPGYQVPAGYQGYHGYVGPMLPPGYQVGPPPGRAPSIGQRNVATTITALGSIALGVGATAIVSTGSNPNIQALMILLIWAAIAVINVVYARRH